MTPSFDWGELILLVDDDFIVNIEVPVFLSKDTFNSFLAEYISCLDFEYLEVTPRLCSSVEDFPHESAMFVTQASYASADYYTFIKNYSGGRL